MSCKQAVRPAVACRTSTVLFSVIGLAVFTQASSAQSPPRERAFPQAKSVVEKTLKALHVSSGGRLPVLDGFTVPGDRPLDRFQRGYYQCSVQVSSTSSGGSLVRVSAKITAWYADPVSSRSGYEVLPSNGRLETDFLDRLEEALAAKGTSSATAAANPTPLRPAEKASTPAPAISAPMPSGSALAEAIAASKTPLTARAGPARGGPGSANDDRAPSLGTQKAVTDKHVEELTKQARNLEEILRNQAHPNNLVVVTKSGTAVLVSPSEGAKVLFLASAEDEFEMLDGNASWVHVRISGLSRGWILRSNLELPESVASDAPTASQAASSPAQPFQVESEQVASFPGTWQPLRGRTVKIIAVQKINPNSPDSGSRAKWEFAKSLFDKQLAELVGTSSNAAGVVLIFDSADGGMMAATVPVLRQWKAGTLSDEALQRRCFFDPPEMFSSPDGP